MQISEIDDQMMILEYNSALAETKLSAQAVEKNAQESSHKVGNQDKSKRHDAI